MTALALIGGLAGVLLASPPARVGAAEPGASLARYDGRDYLLIWPASRPAGVIVFFHTAQIEPLAVEANSGLLDALAASAAARNYAVLAPSAAPGGCDQGLLACWDLERPGDELARADALVDHVAASSGVSLTMREAVGYGRGAELLLAAFAERELSGYLRAGLLEPAPPAAPVQPGAAVGQETLLYLETDMEDAASLARTRAVLDALYTAGYEDRTCTRARTRAGPYTRRAFEDFFGWMSRDCRAAIAPAAAPGGLEPSAEASERRRRRFFPFQSGNRDGE